MGFPKRQKTTRSGDVPERAKGPYIAPPPKPDHNELRRKQYANDPAYADRQRQLARQNYRKDNPIGPSRLANGLLTGGTMREVFVSGMEYPSTVEAFTIPEAAIALGRTKLTLRKWIDDGLIPEPVLTDTSRGFRQYSVGELRAVARVLVAHEAEYSNYSLFHTLTQERMMQAVFGYRSHNI